MTDSTGQSAPDHEGTGITPTTDLMTPDEVREQFPFQNIMRLRENYLTLWDRNRYNVDLLTAEIENLRDRNKELETTIGWYEAKHPND